ncbi:3-hydroxyanthranilic acid dioxygenase [Niveomyces insectorum RCEF 264]|uniref:3-hydroxyanthranilate 3,4-dioxygenase n=1 Tax=Niveomyces insectorum RCEF 264 TaxID=1081102 RepID=A0A167MTU8_9HYPO|nr:3-hydroxyanthranilic acid dioxygenase [Niveomyces insectorum RCEF 264]
MLGPPLNLPKWYALNVQEEAQGEADEEEDEEERKRIESLEENSHLLKPPINNYCVYNDDFTVMIVGGPNARTDYHINETPEWFYQHKGAMMLKVVDEGTFRDVIIREGDMFLLPANTPHNPVRFANTVGVVLEQRRPPASVDRMRWYCGQPTCRAVVHEAAFHCTDLGTQIKAAVEAFQNSPADRTCKNCGTVAESAPVPGSIADPNKA